ncbi:hypothetical protein INT43_001498 [Umbelopsis isabellina]|uniref:Uncharacterized protein n=1 Tax=Mortierella isabellina TaxID=91625 RepID=A0A8H7PEV4_MORIS|nr:hypothetical protein INT43_001498 [Umbelopsis isabellina]
MKCVIAPGNYSKQPEIENWYPSVARKLRHTTKENGERLFSEVVLRQFPDWKIGRESKWMPFLENVLEVGEDDIIIGHSTGSIAAMRWAEKHKIRGIVLVSAYHSDLGEPTEKEAEYFDRPWDFEAIRNNAGFIIQYSSPSDKLVPIAEQRYVSEQMQSEYHELERRGHFIANTDFDQLVDDLLKHLLS